jgi:phage-related protein
MKTDGKVVISTKLDNSGLTKGLSLLKSAFSGLGKIIGSAFAVRTLINFGKEAIELASDLEEVQNVVQVAFGSMSSEVDKFAKNAMKQFGISELNAKQYMGTFGAMSKAFGNSVSEAYEQAKILTSLTGDVASFYNLSTDEAFTKLKGVYTGETEGLKSLGVVMTQTALDEFALANGFGKTTKAMSEQEKVALRLAFVQNALNSASGDFARTSDSWANQTKVLSLQFDNLKTAIGTGLIQALTPAIKMLNQLMEVLVNLANKFSEITAKLFGKQVLPTEQAVSGVESLTEAENELAKATDKATEASKRSLAGFDKLNKLGDDSNKTASSADANGLSGSLGDVSVNTSPAEESVGALMGTVDRLKEKFNTFVAWLKGSDFGSAFDNLKETAQTIGDAFESALEGAKPKIQNSLNGIKTMFSTAGTSIVTVFGGAFKTVTENINEWATENRGKIEKALSGTLGIITGVTDTITSIVTDVFEIITEKWNEYGQPIVDWVSQAVLDIQGRLLTLYNEIIVPILDEALAWVNRIWEENLKDVVDEVIGFVGRVGEWLGILYKEKIKPVIDWLMTYVVPIVKTVLSNIQDTVFIVVNYISGTIKNLLKIINGIIDFLVGVFTGDWERAWQGVQGVLEGIKGQFENTVNTIKEFFTTRFNAIKDTVIGVFEAIRAAIKMKINAMLESVEGMVNGIINGINWLIRKLNSLGTIQIPEILGGGTVGFNLRELSPISIPRLAQGAVIPANREFLAVLGDQKNGRNLELPENLLRQIVREESGGGRHNRIPFIIQLVLNGKVIGEEAVEYVNGVIRKTGKSPIKQGG